jgi:hypothetical protein
MAKDTQKKPSSSSSVTAPMPYQGGITEQPSNGTELTLSQALDVLRYLDGRGLLCSECGYRLATQFNQMHTHCPDCARPGMVYGGQRKVCHFEQLLWGRLNRWVQKFIATEEQGNGPAAGGAGPNPS